MIEKIRDLKFSGKNKFFFLLTLFFFWGRGALGFDTKSFYDCDELFCVKDDGSDKKALIDDIALQIGFEKVQNDLKFDIGQSSQRPEGKAGINTAGVETDESPTSGTADNSGTGENPQDSSQASGWGSGSGGASSAQTGGSQFSATGAAGGQVSGSKVGGTSLGGVNEAKKIRIEGGGAYSSNLASLNRRNRGEPGGTPKNRGSGGTPVYASSGSGGPGGGAGSHSGRTGKKKKGFLSKLAGKLGLGRYFGGGSGGGSSGNFYRGKTYNRRKLKTASKGQAKGRLKSPADILRENFRRNLRRRIANSPEFGSSQISLFQNICEHYDNYARSHSIPDNRKHCPRD